MPSTGCSATASATTGSAITSSASGSTTAGCSGGSLTAGSGSTTGVSSVRAGVSTHSSSCALAGSARCAFSLSTTVSVTSTTSSANAAGSAFGALGSAGVSTAGISSATACCSSTFAQSRFPVPVLSVQSPARKRSHVFLFCHLRPHSSLFIHGAASSEAEKMMKLVG